MRVRYFLKAARAAEGVAGSCRLLSSGVYCARELDSAVEWTGSGEVLGERDLELGSLGRVSSRRFMAVRFSTVLRILTLLDPTVVTGALASCEIVVKVPCKIWLKTGFLASA